MEETPLRQQPSFLEVEQQQQEVEEVKFCRRGVPWRGLALIVGFAIVAEFMTGQRSVLKSPTAFHRQVILEEEAAPSNSDCIFKSLCSVLKPLRERSTTLANQFKKGQSNSAEVAKFWTDIEKETGVIKQAVASSKDVRYKKEVSGLLVKMQLRKTTPEAVLQAAHVVRGLYLAKQQAAVRKTLASIRSVSDYLMTGESIETEEDLRTYVKNLTPGLKHMSELVKGFLADMSSKYHVMAGKMSISIVEKGVAGLLHTLKLCIELRRSGDPGKSESKSLLSSRLWQMQRRLFELSFWLQELGEGKDADLGGLWIGELGGKEVHLGGDAATVLRADRVLSSKMMEWVQDWLASPESENLMVANMVLPYILAMSEQVGKIIPSGASILKAKGALDKDSSRLKLLRAGGKGNSPEALKLARSIGDGLKTLKSTVSDAAGQLQSPSQAWPPPKSDRMEEFPEALQTVREDLASLKKTFRSTSDPDYKNKLRDGTKDLEQSVRSAAELAFKAGMQARKAPSQMALLIGETAEELQRCTHDMSRAAQIPPEREKPRVVVKHEVKVVVDYLAQEWELMWKSLVHLVRHAVKK